MRWTSIVLVCVALAVTVLASPVEKKFVKKLEWWQDTVFYQIYPRSYKDSDGDGIGDLKGITEKLAYLKKTGITATWLSPIFKSPMLDFGYDISDFRDIQKEYGTLADFDAMIQQANELGIKIILDFVPNHSSDQHEWFKKSVRREPGYENYYVWHPGKLDKDGKRVPPNNWVSVFRGSAWQWVEERQEYYYHQFLKEQPDLNFREAVVREEMKDVLRYWLDKGVYGFRVDAVPHLVEVENLLQDEPPSGAPGQTPEDYGYLIHNCTTHTKETFEVIKGWSETLDQWSNEHDKISRVMMTEAYGDMPTSLKYYQTGVSFSFNFNLLIELNGDSNAQNYADIINKWMTIVPPETYTPNWVMGNHDNPRMATRYHKERVDGLNMMLMTLPGIGVTFNGEEIGMENGHVTWEQHQDTACHEDDFATCRDFERTPFQWDSSNNAGFTSGSNPWLPVDPSYTEVNVEKQTSAKESHYHVYQEILRLRKAMSFRHGKTLVRKVGQNTLSVLRTMPDYDGYMLLFNMGSDEDSIDISDVGDKLKIAVRSIKASRNVGDKINKNEPFTLKGYEAYLIRIDK